MIKNSTQSLEKPMLKILKSMTILFFAVILCACNTVAGVGKDIQSGADAVQNSAE